MPPPRWRLQLQAQVLRQLTEVGMTLHRSAAPWPRAPAFSRTISTAISPTRGDIELLFYTPDAYQDRARDQRFAAVVNFHGGGFTIGRASDDARWADAVVNEVGAVVVSINYRLAPEYPFPTPVEDGADAILYLLQHAEELGIDENKIATSGFSAGGNLAFTAPLRLQAELRRRRDERANEDDTRLDRGPADEGTLKAIIAWYPSTDFGTNTRAERRASNVRPETELPKSFTDLFDASYLHPPHKVSMSDPYLSPGLAPAEMLRALPEEIIMYTCEWDELLVEAERFRDRLTTELGKKVTYRKVDGVAHAWDKDLNPFGNNPLRVEIYREACSHLRRVFGQQ